MAITSEGMMVGSVSGGCVENAVVEAGIQSLKTGKPQLLHFGVADETAWEVGLACGGNIDIFVQPFDFLNHLIGMLDADDEGSIVTVVQGPNELFGQVVLIHEDNLMVGSLGSERDELVLKMAQESFSLGRSGRIRLSEDVEIFVNVLLPRPTLVIVGGVHIAVALVVLAKTLGYRTILIDPRKSWGNEERFPHVDILIQSWIPDAFSNIDLTRSTAITMLTHDPKLDDPALRIALTSPAFYVGALGSRTTHAKRKERLLSEGLTESQLTRLHAPIGLDIGAQSPEEIALSIMSDVVKTHRKHNQVSVNKETETYPSKEKVWR